MKPIVIQETINAPPDTVFAMFADFHNAEKNVSGISRIEVLADGPIGVGTRFRETRTMLGREHSEEMEITAFDSPNSYTVEAESCGCHYTSVFRFQPVDKATSVEMSFAGRPVKFTARLMMVFNFLMVGALRKCMQQDIDDLKRVIETHRPEHDPQTVNA